MKKKGFTLVELLAVIAILAILVILALPNVMNMYVRTKKNTFLTEAQNILKESTIKFIQESVNGKKVNVVSNSKNPLNLTGEKLTYTINLNSQGKVTDMYAMFVCSTNLQTIHVNDKFTLKNVTNGSKMFYVNSKLVGGAGTIFNNNNDDKTYAHIDGGTANPGYFTAKVNVVNGKKLTYKVDFNKGEFIYMSSGDEKLQARYEDNDSEDESVF